MSDYLFNMGIIVFMIDNLLCLNTTYFEKGVQIQDRYLIFKHYIKKHLVADFMSNIPVLIDYFVT